MYAAFRGVAWERVSAKVRVVARTRSHYHCDVDEFVERKIRGKNPSDTQKVCECVRSDEQEEITQEPENHQDAVAHISYYSVSALHFPSTAGSYLRATSSVGGFQS